MIWTAFVPNAGYRGRHVPQLTPTDFLKGTQMIINNNASPLEHLAAFAIVFVTAVVGTAVVGKYIDRIREQAVSK